MTDTERMLAVRSGDLAPLGDLFERHHRRLYGFLVRLVGNPAAAEDLVQEVFVRMLRYSHTFSAPANASRGDGESAETDPSFESWMFRVARNAAADYFGRASRETQLDDVTARERPSPEPGAAENLVRASETDLLRRALARVEPARRELLILTRFRYLRHDEIARQLGISVGAVKVRVHRAVQELRDRFREEERAAAREGLKGAS